VHSQSNAQSKARLFVKGRLKGLLFNCSSRGHFSGGKKSQARILEFISMLNLTKMKNCQLVTPGDIPAVT